MQGKKETLEDFKNASKQNLLISILACIVLGCIVLWGLFYAHETSWTWEVRPMLEVLIIAMILVFLFFLYVLFKSLWDLAYGCAKRHAEYVDSKNKIEKATLIDELRKERKKQFELGCISKYGDMTTKFEWIQYISRGKTRSIMIFETSKIILIDNVEYRFEDILEVNLSNDSKTMFSTNTSTSNVLGRAVVGGILLGGVGAILGGVTAKQNTQKQVDTMTYTLKILVNSINNPILSFEFDKRYFHNYTGMNEVLINKLVSTFSIIIERNKK